MRRLHAWPRKDAAPERLDALLLWLGVTVAFSAVLVDMLRDVSVKTFEWSLLVAPLLAACCGRGIQVARRPRPWWGIVLVSGGLLLEIVGVAGNSWSIARAGLPVAIVGVALRTGFPAPSVAMLTAWAIPLPEFLYSVTTPELESALGAGSVGLLHALGAKVSASGPILRSGGEVLRLDPSDGGLHLAWILAAVGWYAGLRNRLHLPGLLSMAGAVALLAIPGQPLGVLTAAALLWAGESQLASFWLKDGLWLVAVISGVIAVEWRHALRKRNQHSKVLDQASAG